MHIVKVLDLPMGKFRDKGHPLDNHSNFDASKEQICMIEPIEGMKEKKVLFGTKTGMLKLVAGEEFDVVRRTSAATKLADGDEVLNVNIVGEEDTVVLQSDKGFFLRMQVRDIPEKKKAAIGVRGMKVTKGETLTDIYVLKPGDAPCIKVGNNEVHLERLRIANRDTRGVKH